MENFINRAGNIYPLELVPIYLLRDEFLTDRAVGAVNGTAAEPIGGNRVVVDTENKLSLINGKLSFSGGKAVGSYTDPQITYTARPRLPGRFVVIEFNVSTLAGTLASIGFLGECLRWNGTVSIIFDNGVASTTIGGINSLVAGTSYRLIVAINSVGSQIFIQGGSYVYPTLLFCGEVATTANVTPVIANRSSVYTSAYIRMPSNVFLLARPLASDGFSLAFGITDGLGHVDGNTVVGKGGSDKNWSVVGTWITALGLANASVLSGGLANAVIDVGIKDVFVSVKLTLVGGVLGVIARYVDANNYLIAYHDGTNAKLDQILAGVTSNLISAVATYVPGKNLILEVDGNNAQLFYNMVRVGAVATVNAAVNGTKHGLYTTDIANQFDDFRCFPRGTNNEYSAFSDFFFNVDNRLFLPIGDSKTNGDEWVRYLVSALNLQASENYGLYNETYAIPGITVATMKAYFDAHFITDNFKPDLVTINLGANDVGSLPNESLWKSNLTRIIEYLKAANPNVEIYIARVWRRGFTAECNTLATWIADVVNLNPFGVHLGMDERVWLENGDDGTTYTTDGIHYTFAAEAIAKTKWLESMGL